MGESLLTAYIDVAVRDGQAVAGLGKVEVTAKKTFTEIDKRSARAAKGFDAMAGRAADAGAAIERGFLRGFGRIGKMLAGGGLFGIAAFEGVRLGMDAISGLFQDKNAEAISKLSDSMRDFRREVVKAEGDTDDLLKNLKEVDKGPFSADAGKKMLSAIDHQMSELQKVIAQGKDKLNDAAGKPLSEDAIQASARELPRGKLIWDQFGQQAHDKAMKEMGANAFTNPIGFAERVNHLQSQWFSGQARDILKGTVGESKNIADLKAEREKILKASGLDPKLFGESVNPFLEQQRNSGGFMNPAEQANKIQEAIFGAAAPASEKGQNEIVEQLKKIVEFAGNKTGQFIANGWG